MRKIALLYCNSKEEIPDTINKLLSLINLEKIIKLFMNKKVLLKINLNAGLSPESRAVTFPLILETIIKLGLDCNAQITVGDGPLFGVKGADALKVARIDQLIHKYSIKWVNFNGDRFRYLIIPNGKYLEKIRVAASYFEADTIINLPVFKTDRFILIDGALKNMMGFLVGQEKLEPYYLNPVKSIVEINRVLKSHFTIMDGFIGRIWNKPAQTRILIGGFDPIAIDGLAAMLLKHTPDQIPLLKHSAAIKMDSLNYELTGDDPDCIKLIIKEPADLTKMISRILLRVIIKILFPLLPAFSKIKIRKKRCNQCLKCIEVCTYKALKKSKRFIIYRHSRCTFCLRCYDVCEKKAVIPKGPVTHSGSYIHHLT